MAKIKSFHKNFNKKQLRSSSIIRRIVIYSACTVLIVAGFYLYKQISATDCRTANLTPFMSNDCVRWVKGMVNLVSGSSLDTTNPGFDGSLHQQLKNLNTVGIFSPYTYGDGSYAVLSPEKYDKLQWWYDEKRGAHVATPTPQPTPPPAPTPPAQVACRDQGLKVGSTGDCVKWMHARINTIANKCYAKQPMSSTGIFDTTTNDWLKWTTAAGNLGTEAKNTGYSGTVTPRLWDIIEFVATAINNGGGCSGTSSLPSTPTAPEPSSPAPNKPNSSTPSSPPTSSSNPAQPEHSSTQANTNPSVGSDPCPKADSMDLGLMLYIDGVNNKGKRYDENCHNWYLTYANNKNKLTAELNRQALENQRKKSEGKGSSAAIQNTVAILKTSMLSAPSQNNPDPKIKNVYCTFTGEIKTVKQGFRRTTFTAHIGTLGADADMNDVYRFCSSHKSALNARDLYRNLRVDNAYTK